ncbi:MAG TPA: cytochrome c-type biogenesis CcmF C-terminal domain-containing protein [Aggregatilineaceae bacterium]|nr:cytochrome c-type biogenesis CcmF C-terminal domain-containing protein [Aggregatilineaceae bacterium]
MIAEIGMMSTGFALVAAAYAILAAGVGVYLRRDKWVVSARNAALLTFPLLTLSCLIMIFALLNHEYSLEYVRQTTDNATPSFYLYTALWGHQEGSLLFWSWLMSGFTFGALLLNWKSERRLMPFVIVATMVTLGFFLILNNFLENPWKRVWAESSSDKVQIEAGMSGGTVALFAPSDGAVVAESPDGQGLNPLLRHVGMVIHPPMLYLGFVGFVIPFAFAFAALATGQLGAGWLRATRGWALVAWMFLSLGLLLGGRWAYDVLGWGGYWGWDPVENSALLPWLSGTAFLHSAVVQEKRGMLKFWNMLLIIITFLLVILGTFATRSGVISSVHAFAESEIGHWMFAFLGLATLTSIVLLGWRQERGDLRGADELDSLFSREGLFLINNWLFLGLTVIVLWGTWAEAVTTVIRDLGLRDTIINYGAEYYPPRVRYLLIALYILMGIAPLAAWRRSTAKALGRAIVFPTLLALGFLLMLYLAYIDWNRVSIGFKDTDFGIVLDELADTLTELFWPLLGYGLVAFAGFATLTEIWKGVSARHRRGENYGRAFTALVGRDRHRYGGYCIHLGMVILGLGVIGSTGFQQSRAMLLSPGDTVSLGSYEVKYEGLTLAEAEDGRGMVIARAKIYKDGKFIEDIRPRRDLFLDSAGNITNIMSIPDAHSSLAGDVYVRVDETGQQVLTHFNEGNPSVNLRVYLNPLINFVWFGGVILMIGTLVAMWPSRHRTAQPVAAAAGLEQAGAGR